MLCLRWPEHLLTLHTECKSSYIRAPKARESLGFYPKSYSGFGSSRSCAPPLVDDSALSPEELGSSPARIVQLSRSHGGKVDSRIGTRKRESPGRPYPREGEECKSSYIRAPKARESLGFYPKSYSGFGSSRSCAPPLVDDSALSPEELGSSPARIGQLSRSHGGKVDSRIGTRKRESPGRPYPREGEECKSSYIRAPKARESLGFYPKSYTEPLSTCRAAKGPIRLCMA